MEGRALGRADLRGPSAARLPAVDRTKLLRLHEVKRLLASRQGLAPETAPAPEPRASQQLDGQTSEQLYEAVERQAVGGWGGLGAPAAVPAPEPTSPRRSLLAAELARSRRRAFLKGDRHMVNRLHTKECQAGMQRQLRMQQYGEVQRQVNGIEHRASLSAAAEAQTEISTQTELPMPSELPGGELAVEKELSELREERIQTILASDEQALENLAEADLAYLDMVRAKSGFHHQTAGAVATSKAEHALAESWQQLIMLRLKSQKLQLQQQVQPMPTDAMKRTEDQLMQETTRIANNLQRQLADLTRHHAAASAEMVPTGAPTTRGASRRRAESSMLGRSAMLGRPAPSHGGPHVGIDASRGRGPGCGRGPLTFANRESAKSRSISAPRGGRAPAPASTRDMPRQQAPPRQQTPLGQRVALALARAGLANTGETIEPPVDWTNYGELTPWNHKSELKYGARPSERPLPSEQPRRRAPAPVPTARPPTARPPTKAATGGVRRPVTAPSSVRQQLAGRKPKVVAQHISMMERTLACMERQLTRQDAQLSQLKPTERRWHEGVGSLVPGERWQLDGLQEALVHSHSWLDDIQGELVKLGGTRRTPASSAPARRPRIVERGAGVATTGAGVATKAQALARRPREEYAAITAMDAGINGMEGGATAERAPTLGTHAAMQTSPLLRTSPSIEEPALQEQGEGAKLDRQAQLQRWLDSCESSEPIEAQMEKLQAAGLL